MTKIVYIKNYAVLSLTKVVVNYAFFKCVKFLVQKFGCAKLLTNFKSEMLLLMLTCSCSEDDREHYQGESLRCATNLICSDLDCQPGSSALAHLHAIFLCSLDVEIYV